MTLGMALAGPSEGTYDLFDKNNRKIGEVRTTIEHTVFQSKPSTHVVTVTEINVRRLFKKYTFKEVDQAFLLENGVAYFKREINDNGKVSVLEGKRRGSDLQIFSNENGNRIIFPIRRDAFDMSEYEMEFPQSKFWNMNEGEGRTANVLIVEAREAIRVVRNMGQITIKKIGERKIPVYVVNTNVGGRITTSWIQAGTHALIREEGPEHILVRRFEKGEFHGQ